MLMLRLYDFLPSGNCYKVRLLLHQLEVDFELVEVNILTGESRTPEFLSKNPNGRVPVLEIESGKFLAESNAILYYLSVGTDFLPSDRLKTAQVMQWLFFEQYSHEPYIATSRFWISILGAKEKYNQQLQEKQAPGYAA
ncbi:glutathione S-transferase, partial [Oscillatoria salina IIICB1]|nr:glutathione S-transferase [Oscillatoria salina IIICB1]